MRWFLILAFAAGLISLGGCSSTGGGYDGPGANPRHLEQQRQRRIHRF